MAVGIRKGPKWQKLEEEITCPVCGDIFVNPITTPCLHTFCRECLKASIEATMADAMAEVCPVCRRVLSKALDCPADFRIERLIKTFKQLRVTANSSSRLSAHHSAAKTRTREKVDCITRCCGKCEEDVPTVIWCIECQASLCYDCNEIHGKWKEFKLHSTVTIGEYLNNMSNYVIKQHSSNAETLSQEQNGYGEVIQERYIPREYLQKSLETYSWYFGAITREDAELILMQRICGYKSFLVRDCETKCPGYILSIRDTFKVRHYKIHKLGDEFCISLLVTFKTVIELVSHYTHQTRESCYPVQCYRSGYKLYSNFYGSNIQFTRMVEAYQFYELWEGVWCHKPVTIKKLRNVSVGVSNFLKEVKLMQHLEHKCNNIIWPFGISSLEAPLCIITERTCGNLKSYLKVKGNSLTIHQIIDIGVQVASAMIYLESIKCVHRSLCAKNIALVLSHRFIFKVTNFTLARILSKHDYVESTPQEQFPIKWTAPESLKTNRFTIKSDVWSFGVVVYETTTCGGDPYPRMVDSEVLNNLDAGYRMLCPTGCPQKLYTTVMKMCWRKNVNGRPTFVMIRENLMQICTCVSCSRHRIA